MVRGVCISAFLALLSFFTKGRCQDLLNSYFFRVVSGTKFFRLLQQQERVSGSLVDLVHLNYSKPLWVSRATSNLTPGSAHGDTKHKASQPCFPAHCVLPRAPMSTIEVLLLGNGPGSTAFAMSVVITGFQLLC